MPLRRLSSLERKKIEQEHKEMLARIRELEALLGSEKRMRDQLVDELAQVKSTYGDRRRTLIVEAAQGQRQEGPPLLTAGDLTPEKETWVVVTDDGLDLAHADGAPAAADRTFGAGAADRRRRA